MRNIQAILFFPMLLLLCGSAGAGPVSVSVLKWKGGAAAAYTIIHDDLCNPSASGIHRYADTIAYNRGIRFGAGAIVGSCVRKGEPMWMIMERMVRHGHEMLSHTWSHGAAVDLGRGGADWDVGRDVVMTKKVIEENVPGASVLYMIFPYDAYNDDRLEELKHHGYLGSRSGRRMYNDRGVVVDFSNYDPFRSNLFDAFVSKEEQDQLLAGRDSSPVSIYDNANDDIEIQHVDAAIKTGGWSIQELHSVDDEQPWGWGRMGVDRYRALLDYVSDKADRGLLWVEPPTTVLRYIMTREHIDGPHLVDGNTLTFSLPGEFDARYATEISVEIRTGSDVSTVTGRQGDKTITARKTGNRTFVMDINPVLGDVALSYNR